MNVVENVGVFIKEKGWLESLVPENYPEERIECSDHGESLKPRINQVSMNFIYMGPCIVNQIY